MKTIFSVLVLSALASFAGAQEVLVSTFPTTPRPVYGTFAPGEADRLYIVNQGFNNGEAAIRILDLQTGTLLSQPFLMVEDVVCCQEAGLLCLAFHPDYQANGLVYITRVSDGVNSGFVFELVEYAVLSDDQVNPATERTVLSVEMSADQHNGGWIGFGPDGYLYATIGDDQFGMNAQDNSNLLGTVVRIDPTGTNGPTGEYGIPASNPFVGTGDLEEIWAYGLRNPWRASFDRLTGDLYIGDVGGGQYEEVSVQLNLAAGGANYGWPIREGTDGNELAGAIDPIHDYFHSFGQFDGLCVIGGYVYRGPVEFLQGKYIFGDNRFGKVWSLEFDGSDPVTHDGTNFTNLTSWTEPINDQVGMIPRISSFAEDFHGNIWVFDYANGLAHRIDGAFVRGDINCDGAVNLLDVGPFVDQVSSGVFSNKADVNGDGSVNLLDVDPFVALLAS